MGAANTTAISVAKDMTEGIIARFKTMRIWRPAVLAGHVVGGLILAVISVAVTIGVALLIGYAPPPACCNGWPPSGSWCCSRSR